MKKVLNLIVPGGKATPAPPLGPAIAPLGLNIGKVVADINAKTKQYNGLRVPVKLIVNLDDKSYEIEVGKPFLFELIKKEAGIEKGSGKSKEEFVGDISFERLVKVVKEKIDEMNTSDLKKAVLQGIGICISAGIKIEGKDPRVVKEEVKEGKYDDKLK